MHKSQLLTTSANSSGDRTGLRANTSRNSKGDSINSLNVQEKAPSPSELCMLWTKLKESDCPYVENLEEWSLTEILQPCDLRIKILQWMLISLGVHEKMLLQPGKNLRHSANEVDFRYQNLLKACNVLGLAEKQDMDLIMGKAGGSRQVSFFCFVLDLVIQIGPVFSTSVSFQHFVCSTPINSTHRDIGADFSRKCNLVDALLESGAVAELKGLNFKLPDDKCLPKELQPDRNAKKRSTESLKSSWSPAQYQQIQSVVTSLEDTLQQQLASFAKLQELVAYSPYEEDSAFVALEKLNKQTQALQEATISFNERFEKDLKIWCCCSTSPEPSPLDPLTIQLHTSVKELMQFCENLNSIRTSFNKITTDLNSKLSALLQKKDDDVGASFREQLPDWMEVLQEAIALQNNEPAVESNYLSRQ